LSSALIGKVTVC